MHVPPLGGDQSYSGGTASRPPEAGLAALCAGEAVAARSGLVQLVLHGPDAVVARSRYFSASWAIADGARTSRVKVIQIVVWSLRKGPSLQGSTLCRVLDTVRWAIRFRRGSRSNVGASETIL